MKRESPRPGVPGNRIDFSMLSVIFSLAWPTMLEQLMQTAVQYIDTAMVGSLGTLATAAVGATTTVNWMIGSTISAIGIGFLAIISQSLGAKDERTARKAAAQAVTITVLVGLCMTAITTLLSPYVPVWMQVDPEIREKSSRYFLILYSAMLFRTASVILGTVLRSAGDTKTPMRVGILVNLINVALNFLLIYPVRPLSIFGFSFTMWGMGWGVEGAAAASAFSIAFGGIAITVMLFRHRVISPRKESFRPDAAILRRCFRIAVPNLFQRFITSLGYVVFAAMINSLGEISTAAHTVANTVESAFYIPGYGMQAAAATLSGNACGAKDAAGFRRLGRSLVMLEVLMMIFSGGLLFLFAEKLVRIFTADPQVITLGVTVLRMVALSEPFYGIPIIVEGMMQGAGQTRLPLIFNVSCMWGVRIVGTWICTRLLGLGLVSAWGCMIAHNLTLFFLFGYCYLKGKFFAAPSSSNHARAA